MAKFYAIWFASVFAANSQFDVLAGFPCPVACDFHELTDTILIDRGERISRDDLVLKVGGQKAAGVIPAHPKRGLRKIVGSKAEELSFFGDFFRSQRGSRNFDHGAHEIFQLYVLLFADFFGDAVYYFDLQRELFWKADQRKS